MPKAAAAPKAKKTPTKKAAKAKGEKKEKKVKDPNAPKKPLGAYMFFCADARSKIKAENPDAKITEVAKLLGEAWAKVSDKEKEKYQKKAAADKERYTKAMEKYKA